MDFYYTDDDGAVFGPVSSDQLQKLVDAGVIAAGSQACYEGSQDWKPISAYVSPTAKQVTTQPAMKASTTASAAPLPQPATATYTPNRSVPRTSPAVVTLLSALVALTSIDVFFRCDERTRRTKEDDARQEIIRAVVSASTDINRKRMEVLSNYKNLDDNGENKWLIPLVHHASNAQLELLNLFLQEQQLLIQLLAGKR